MEKKRNYGIDLLRIVSMYMIVLLHIVGFSEITDYSQWNSNNYVLCNFIRSATFCGVNCFALISGYVGIDADFRISRLVMNWVRVLWYSITITLVLVFIFGVDADLYTWITSLFPVSMTAYWYFTEYFRMFFLIPLFNKIVKKRSKRAVFILLSMIIIFIFFNQEKVSNGYHFLWLSLLYICGAYIKKHNPFSSLGKSYFFIIYILSSLLTMFNYMLYDAKVYEFSLQEYTSPTVFLASISLLLLFSKIKIGDKMQMSIKKIVPLVFSVYLFHTHPLFFKEVIGGLLKVYSDLHFSVCIIIIFLTGFIIFVISCIFEYIRVFLFQKMVLSDKISRVDFFLVREMNKSAILKKIKLEHYLYH